MLGNVSDLLSADIFQNQIFHSGIPNKTNSLYPDQARHLI